MIAGTLPLAAIIVAATFLAFWLERRVPAVSKVGASLLALILGALLSNTGAVPAASPVYDAVAGPVTLLAIAWLLLAVDVSDLKRVGPRMGAAFALAVAATVVGAAVATALFADAIGPEAPQLAGALTGSYSGGSLNFVAVGQGLGLSPALFTGAAAADALMTGVWLAVTIVLPVWLGRYFPPVPEAAFALPDESPKGDGWDRHPFFQGVSLSTLDLARLLALGLVLVFAAEALAGWLGAQAEAGRVPEWLGGVPSVLWLTTFALTVGHTRRFGRPPGALQLGNLALHGFFVVIGIWSRVGEILAVGLEVFYFTATLVLVHGVVVYGVGRLVRLDAGSLSVASQAAIGGPSSALAVAVAREWPGFVVPGVVVGLAGYALGTYLGMGLAGVLTALGVG